MSIYRFIGSQGAIIDSPHTFHRFGQKAEIDDKTAAEKIADGFPILPGAAFDALGFTEKELTDYPSAQSHEEAPQSFKDKKRAALMALHELRRGKPAATAPPTARKSEESATALTDQE